MIQRECPACGATYDADPVRLRHGRQTTCSRACSYALRGQNRQRLVTIDCAVCGQQVERAVSHIKGKHGAQFCSRACHYAGRAAGLSPRVVVKPYAVTDEGRVSLCANALRVVEKRKAADNYAHTEDTRRKLSDASARALAEGRVRRTSKLEDKVADVLDAAGIAYVRQWGVRDRAGRFRCVVDFLVGDVALEVNGTYWHADPRVYVEHNATQAHNAERFAAKCDLLRALGLRVAQVWEIDLKCDPAQAVLDAYARAT